MISLSYSRISLADIAEKLSLESTQDAEYIVAKAIRDGAIEAVINHREGYVQSKVIPRVYKYVCTVCTVQTYIRCARVYMYSVYKYVCTVCTVHTCIIQCVQVYVYLPCVYVGKYDTRNCNYILMKL